MGSDRSLIHPSRPPDSKPPTLPLCSVTSSTSGSSLSLTLSLILSHGRSVNSCGLVDSGAQGFGFVDVDFCKKHSIPLVEKTSPIEVETVDGSPISSGKITHQTVPLQMVINSHRENISLDVIISPNQPVILGFEWLQHHNPVIDWSSNQVYFNDKSSASVPPRGPPATKRRPIKIQALNARAFAKFIKPKAQIFAVFVVPSGEPSASKPSQLPPQYYQFSKVFSEKEANKLPPHRSFDCKIDLIEGKEPPYGPIYQLTETELQLLRDYIESNLAKGFIRPSTSPAGAPVLFVPKPGGGLRLCVDYRGLNKITIKNRYPLPLISELLDRLRSAKIFTKIDLRSAYNLVRIREGDEYKTAFRTRYGHFEYLVMPFGLTNAPAAFQSGINEIFYDCLDKFVVIYLDDILIFSNNEEQHEEHVKLVLQRLQDHGLYAKLEKCEFHQTSISYLGYVISPDGISMDKSKVSAINDWSAPKSQKDIQVFLGFCNFYRRFIPNFSKLAQPLTSLLKKNAPFSWTSTTRQSFDSIKQSFASEQILAHPNPDQQYIVEVDASNFGLGCILSQYDSNNILRPISFHSRSLSSAERNYVIGDKELLALKVALEEWRHYLEQAKHPVLVYTDHKNLEYMESAKIQNSRHARWALFFSRFNLQLTYRPGSKNGKADALSRKPQSQPTAPIPPSLIINSKKISILSKTQNPSSDFLTKLKTLSAKDEFYLQNASQPKHPLSISQGLLHRHSALYIPEPLRLEILQSRHDSLVGGHFGINKTYSLITRDYWWPGLSQDVKLFVRSCDTCNRNKSPRHKPYGQLQSIPIPTKPWSSVSLDFITDLPDSFGFTTIMTVVDRFSKMAHFIPVSAIPSASQTVELFLNNIFRLHGIPNELISDRGPQFTSAFWKEFFTRFDTKIKLSTAYHPQTDGQTERVNQILEQYLRSFISYNQDNWTTLLPFAEFSYNSSLHSSTNLSPFEVNYGFNPTFDPRLLPSNHSPPANDFLERIRKTQSQLSFQLAKAQLTQKLFADKKRLAAPQFKPGDQVWLLRNNIPTDRPSSKLDYRRLGPYKILQQINPVAYKLELPPTVKLHPVFHTSLLHPYHPNTFKKRHPEPPPTVVINGEIRYIVKDLLDTKIVRNKRYFLVDWEGYTPNDRTWEPESNIPFPLRREFLSRYKERRGRRSKRRA